MGSKSMKKLYFRLVLLISFSFVLIYDYLNHTQLINQLINTKILHTLSIIHIFWIYLIIEMVIVFVPKFNNHSYSGKHLLKHYLPPSKYDVNKLNEYTKQNGKKAFRSAIFWIVLNIPFAILFFMGYLESTFFYWLFFLYYFFDTVCVNIFCVFHIFLMRNKCCNECRIFNWGYVMYCTPLLFIPNIWNYSLITISIIVLVQWELSVYYHPERFSSISNVTLQCKNCSYECRYNSSKNNFIQYLNKFGQSLYQKLKKEKI